MAKKWIALFSQTGSEIVNIVDTVGRAPDLVMTNNKDSVQWNDGIRQTCKNIMVNTHDKLMGYLRENTEYAPEDTVITLHGYLRIVPEDVCGAYIMFNGHPAAIDLYEELKGKDPQVRTWKGYYPTIGSVVHRVTAGVDEGPLVSVVHRDNTAQSEEELYGLLKETSLQSWLDFLKDYECV
jgi:folate-dependent phosphoribosylglycinamide formyltransferase PurN